MAGSFAVGCCVPQFCPPATNRSSAAYRSFGETTQSFSLRLAWYGNSPRKKLGRLPTPRGFGNRPVSLLQIGSSCLGDEPERNRDPLLTAEPQEAAERSPTS